MPQEIVTNSSTEPLFAWNGPPAHVLHVDDHGVSREMMAYILEASGLTVTVAYDGQDAVEKAINNPPDIILMDLRMPRLDGFRAITALRDHQKTAHIPIIVISAWANAKHKKRSHYVGANEHFSKPIDFLHLLAVMRRYLK